MLSRLTIPRILQRNPGYVLPALLVIFSSLAFLRIWLLRDIIWDDNFWAETLFECQGNYDCFFNSGFLEMARPQLAPYIYFVFWLYKSTEYYYVVWHVIDTLTSVGSPLLLFLFLKNLFPKKQELAFFSAAAFVIFNLDQTLGFLSASNYRIGSTLTILSFYLTACGFQKDRVLPGYLAFAAVCAVLSHSIFIEATIALEPARGLAIAYLVKSRLAWARPVWRWTLRYWYLFVLLTLPIIAYKLLYKPYGMYGHMYGINPLFFLEWRATLVALTHYLQFSWITILHNLEYVTVATWVLAAATIVGTYMILYRTEKLPVFGKLRAKLEETSASRIVRSAWQADKQFLFLGLLAFILPALFFQVVSRPPITILETYSSHAVVPQMGYAMLTGWLLAVCYRASILRDKRDPWVKYFVAGVFGVGVFFNSATIDQYLGSWTVQNRLWTDFTKRFPAIPDGKYFVFDVPSLPTLYSDTGNMYTLELHLNLLYATDVDPSPFRRVAANDMQSWGRHAVGALIHAVQNSAAIGGNKIIQHPIQTRTFFGQQTVQPEDFIFVRYRNGELLVNEEISKKYPEIWYKVWLDRPFPELPMQPASYPLRHRMRGPGAEY